MLWLYCTIKPGFTASLALFYRVKSYVIQSHKICLYSPCICNILNVKEYISFINFDKYFLNISIKGVIL